MPTPTIISEPSDQIQSAFFKPELGKPKVSLVSFPWEIAIYPNEVVRIQIDTTFEAFNKDKVLIAKLVMRSISSTQYLSVNQESRKIVEYLIYKSYDAMIKAHKYQYKSTILINYEVRLPFEDEIANDVTNLLNALPLSS